MDNIDEIIRSKGITPASCDYHTRRTLEDGGKIRVLRIKGDKINHVEYTCSKCKHEGYMTVEYVPVSKAAKVRFTIECEKCKTKIKVEKLKGKKEKKAKK